MGYFSALLIVGNGAFRLVDSNVGGKFKFVRDMPTYVRGTFKS